MERELRVLRNLGNIARSLECLGVPDLAEELDGIRRELFDRYEALLRDAASDEDLSD